MKDDEKPSYYGILPANVRYAKITPMAKIMYTEITALAQKEGYCYASNKYFAKLYEVAQGTVSRWIAELKDLGVITITIEDCTKRKIYIANTILPQTLNENVIPHAQKCDTYPTQKREHNNTSNNTKTKYSSTADEFDNLITTTEVLARRDLHKNEVDEIRGLYVDNHEEMWATLGRCRNKILYPIDYFREAIERAKRPQQLAMMLKGVQDNLAVTYG